MGYDMGKYILKRFGYMVVVLMILSFLMFFVYSLIPFDRAVAEAEPFRKGLKTTENATELYLAKIEELRKELGTDQNVVVRYLGWIGLAPINGKYNGILQGNLGYSYEYDRSAKEVLADPLKNTVFINIFATILGLGITIPLGIFCAVHRGSKRDTAVQVGTIVGYSIPGFIIAIVFIWLFAIVLGWFPVSGMKTPGSNYTGFAELKDRLYYMALPLIVMTFSSLGGMTRYVRASMSEALSLDCIRTARAKGLVEKTVIYSHAFRNALIPIITLVIGWFIGIFSGSIVIENIFGLNGVGRIYILSLNSKDFEVVLLLQMFYVILGLLGNLIVDIAYGLADPRVRVNK
ncbi:Dipeptide transport system permease protein DppB [Acetatifactor muris]|jgi:peptide/nickel transport system permease protein|uniref:Dipeptide transport system permease protein DppB n=2 Tax=Acetatifactor muris TaxID=879566 RepID=A0A2K4ZN50_9FIRM|nr:Dipeptide transport system permease protein DppB [Acetatifactor muris]